MTPRKGALRWRKSSQSGGTNGNCVELAHTMDAVRDSKNPAALLPVDEDQLAQLVAVAKAGRLTR